MQASHAPQPGRNRALIFANGEQFNRDAVQALVQPGDFLIACDGGLRHLLALGMAPDLLIGDLDSVLPAQIEQLKTMPTRIEQYPVHKNETDLELAIGAALREGCKTILILGALGGRLDMTLANIYVLALPELAEVDARLEDGMDEVFLIQPGLKEGIIDGASGDRVSLLPLGGPAGGIRTEGLYYPLRGETLYPERTRGVSNQMVTVRASVTLESGVLICIHSHQPPAGNRFNEEKNK